jgi:hypothetical protein
MMELFMLIRSVILHYTRAQPHPAAIYPYNPETRDKAHKNLLKIGQRYEELRQVRQVIYSTFLVIIACKSLSGRYPSIDLILYYNLTAKIQFVPSGVDSLRDLI